MTVRYGLCEGELGGVFVGECMNIRVNPMVGTHFPQKRMVLCKKLRAGPGFGKMKPEL